jgi:FkbM family methyltransferase
MVLTNLEDGTPVHCLIKTEAIVLDHHVNGYLKHGITINEGDVIFDVGANIGIFGIRAIQLQPKVTVFAFEPVPDIFDVLTQNSTLHGDGRLICLPFGASDRQQDVDLHYYPNSPALSTAHPELWDANPDMLTKAVAGSVKNAPPSMWYAKFLPSFLNAFLARRLRSRTKIVAAELRTVSSVIEQHQVKRINLLKIDCEGSELDVLNGISPDHWPLIQSVVTEVHDLNGRLDTICELLFSHGLTNITVETEAGFEDTVMVNIYAHRTYNKSQSPN